jgi:3-hydroxyacyl-[acyl-carrier-protein] dehydratase
MLSHAEIKQILPYRYPMLLIDTVVLLEEGEIVARKNITGTETCFSGLSDDADHSYPNSLIIESMCQAGGIIFFKYYVNKSDGKMGGLLASLKNFQFFDRAFPGDVIEHHVKVERVFEKEIFLSGEIWVGERKIAAVELAMGGIRS